MPRLRAVWIVSATAVLLASCVQTGGQRSTGAPARSSARPSASSASAAKPTALSGIICFCPDSAVGSRTVTLWAIDPVSGVVTFSRQFRLPQSVESKDFGGDFNTYGRRWIFGQDFKRLAVQLEGFPDGSVHAGYVEGGTNEVIDLTAKRSPGGFTSAPQDYGASFGPAQTGLVVYSRVEQGVYKVSDKDGALVPWTGPTSGGGEYFIIGAGGWLLPGSCCTPSYVPNPSGSFASNGVDFVRRGGYVGNALYPGDEVPITGPGCRLTSGLPAGVVSWVDNDSYLCTVGNQIFYEHLDLLTGKATGWQVTPDTSRVNSSPIPSPSHNEVAFVSQQGETVQLFRVPLRGGTPTLVATLPQGAQLLEWWP